MAERTDSLSTSSSKRRSEDDDCISEFDSHSYLWSLNNELKREAKRSNLEILLLLNYCVTNSSSQECQCFLEHKDSSERLIKHFTLIKDILVHVLDKVSEASVQGLNSDCKCDYELNLIYLFAGSLKNFFKTILSHRQDLYNNKLTTTIKQIDLCIKILIVRYVWQCRNKFIHWSKSRADSSRGQVRYHFFQIYEDNASLGRFPHIYWQGTDLSKKIIQHDSLEEIFSKGNEEKCCVCLEGGEDFQNDFAIFLNCDHIVCVPCAEQLLVENIKSRLEFVHKLYSQVI